MVCAVGNSDHSVRLFLPVTACFCQDPLLIVVNTAVMRKINMHGRRSNTVSNPGLMPPPGPVAPSCVVAHPPPPARVSQRTRAGEPADTVRRRVYRCMSGQTRSAGRGCRKDSLSGRWAYRKKPMQVGMKTMNHKRVTAAVMMVAQTLRK